MTERLVLRRWDPRDAAALKAAIDETLAELKAWVPWGAGEPTELPVMTERLARFRDEFGTAGNWGFGIFDAHTQDALGGIGLHGRVGPTAVEIGYWVRNGAAGRGIASEAVRALTAVACGAGVTHVEIHCDPRNTASARVAGKAGYRHVETRLRDYTALGGEPRDTMIWVWPPGARPHQPQQRAPDLMVTLPELP